MGGWEPDSIYFDQDKLYQWCCRGENCPYCNIMNGRIYKLDVYITSTVYPGFHQNCDCYLKEVPAGTKESDLDIFGSALNMRNNAWLSALFGDFENLWIPNYLAQPSEFLSFAKPGMTARQAMALLKKAESKKFGMFKNYGFPFSTSYSWTVFRNANADLYKTFDQLLTSWRGTFPKPAPLRPVPPAQTYHNTLYNLGR